MKTISPKDVSLRPYWEERDLHRDLMRFQQDFFNEVFKEVKPESIIIFGCGLGRELGLTNKVDVWGVDYARKNVRVSHQRFPQANIVLAALQNLPFRRDAFDLGISEGVLQHIPHEDIVMVVENMQHVAKGLLLSEAIGCPEDFYQFSHDYEALFQSMILAKKIPDVGMQPHGHFFLFIRGENNG